MHTFEKSKTLVLKALKENPLVFFRDDHEEEMLKPDFELTFEDLSMDSLAFTELSIWLENELGFVIPENKLQELGTLIHLSQYIYNLLLEQSNL